MVQRVQTILISDLSGDEMESGGESVPFSYKGVDYTIDLTAKEAAGFDKTIAMYVEHARKASRTSRPSRTLGSTQSHNARIQDMKKWAAARGMDYPKRGRLPNSLVDAYDAAH